MPTLSVEVWKKYKRKDGTFNVKIAVAHKGKTSYLALPVYVTRAQVDKNFRIKDDFIDREVTSELQRCRGIITKLGLRVNKYASEDLVEYLKNGSREGSDIDFLQFARKNIEKDKQRTREIKSTALNALKDFVGSDVLPINNITAKFLQKFEEHIRRPKSILRPGKGGKQVSIKTVGGDTAVYNYMTSIRTLFRKAMDEYNDEDSGELRIFHYPFKKYKVVQPPPTKKQNIGASGVRSVRDFGGALTSRGELARDVFMLSFYLIGMNTTDLFHAPKIKDGRLSYNRAKTTDRRRDDAFISIKIEPEAHVLVERYADITGKRAFNFYKRYVNDDAFNKALNIGLKQIGKQLKMYAARHSWASIARNDCGFSKDVVAECLNHVSGEHRTTDIYIQKSFALVDRANRAVLDTLLFIEKVSSEKTTNN